jgi:hypothetical protein
MTPTRTGHPGKVYKIGCDGGRNYVIYNAAAIGNPLDHVPDKWYFRPYLMNVEPEALRALDSAEEAERAARAWDAEYGGRRR